MAGSAKKKGRNEILERKREAERRRYQKIKNDPEKFKIQQEKERQKYLKKKNNKKVKPINEMTPRQQRLQRKAWREAGKKYRAKVKQKKALIARFTSENTPESTDAEDQINTPFPLQNNETPRTHFSPINIQQKLAKMRKLKYVTSKAKDKKYRLLQQKLEKYKKRCKRLRMKLESKISPNNQTKILMKSPASVIRKSVLAIEVLKKQLRENYLNLKSDRGRQLFTNMITGKVIKKYKLQNYLSTFLKYKRTSKLAGFGLSLNYLRKNRENIELKKSIEKFLEQDIHSKLCPGKKDVVRKNKIVRQKRFLNNTMKNLYVEYIKLNPEISYSLFCRMRPFWIQARQMKDRETCECIIHSNFELLIESLFRNQVIKFKSANEILLELCCSKYEERCLIRACTDCVNKNIEFNLNNDTNQITYYKWGQVNSEFIDKNRQKQSVKKTKKLCTVSSVSLAVEEFKLNLNKFMNHERNILHQYCQIKKLKENLSTDECLIHMDFSENYNLKYSNEIQSFHFGGSRQQISLHTVVIYYKDETNNLINRSYGTFSISLNHSPAAIVAHLKPIFDFLMDLKKIKNLHFLSDSPATQYRNKTMFYFMINKFKDYYHPLQNFTWNYSESGHGKGAPDGIGGALKRSADRIMLQGIDIDNINKLVNSLKIACSGIIIEEISTAKIEEVLQEVKEANIKQFVGTMKVHQVAGNSFSNEAEMRSLSCFICPKNCNHFKIGTLDYQELINTSCSDSSFLEERPHNLLKLNISDVYSSTESENDQSKITSNLKSGTYVLVEFKDVKKQKIFTYVAVCQNDPADGEIQIMALKSTGKNTYTTNDTDVSYVALEQIKEILDNPQPIMKGSRVFYKFNKI